MFPNVVRALGITPLTFARAKGGENIKSNSHIEHKEHTFDSFCKKVLKHEANDYHRRLKYRREHEISFSELSEEVMKQIAIQDTYFENTYLFKIMGFEISITDELLGEALKTLSKDRLEIILLSYFLGLSDVEIANQLNLVRRTVAYRRTSSLQTLKNYMEENANE